MNAEPEHFRFIRLHKAWADRFALLWMFSIVLLFGGVYAFLEEVHADAAARSELLVFLAVLVLSALTWQAVGLGIARIHMVIAGIDLEKLAKEARRTRK
ncbi:MAG: hypothetical protein J0J01_03595 [Reyranella sp.]|uniref:hypothetical protein n=1 Tax=Reyranella sp. TaxID=1929291 RepID=UPI001ACF936C|nr:hypothetical protein [Reyranella sp.]MBN9085971.1 hypothetical protein [Reyranella sp.]